MSTSTIDQQFIEFIVKSLVGNPDAVIVDRRIDEKGVLLELTVDPEDLGRVIGKRGATAQSLRTLLRALGTKNEARYNLKIVDTGEGSYRSESSPVRDDEAVTVSAESVNSEDNAPDSFEEAKEEDQEDEDQTSDALAKARKELDDMDDLDI